jgi:transposase
MLLFLHSIKLITMSYIVEQKIKGRVYLYEVTCYWDNEKKQPRQKRKYIGPKHKRLNKSSSISKSDLKSLISFNYGNILLLNKIASNTGLEAILKKIFPTKWEDILALAYYDIMEGQSSYKFSYWLLENYLPDVKKMSSSDISVLYEFLGGMQNQRMEFMKLWSEHIKPINGIYYDITSISSYSNNIDYIEWGYNRDKENLPQLNLGLVCSKDSNLPFYYSLFTGSIVDVSTIKNQIKYLNILNIKTPFLVMDRGFCSIGNITEMDLNKFLFIQPLSFNLKKVKDLIFQNKDKIHKPEFAFKYNQDILYYIKSSLEINGKIFCAHIYLNEKSEIAQKHLFLSKLIEVEQKYKDKHFNSKKEFEDYYNNYIPNKLKPYYQWNEEKKKIERNIKTFENYISNIGYIIFLSNKKNIDKSYILDCYRQKDSIEKMFDVLKNEFDGNRLRVHSNINMEGKLFVKFISLIVYMKISQIMNKNKLFEKYSLKEMLLELKKIKQTIISNHQPIISEVSKKQKEILEIFDIKIET